MSTSSFSLPALIDAAGDDAQDVYITQSIFDLADEKGAMPSFVAAYRAKYGQDPDLYAGHGYDAVMLLGEATKHIISTLPSEFLKGLRSVEPLAGSTGLVQFNESGDAQKFPRIHWIDKGVPRDFQKMRAERRKEVEEELAEIRRQTERLRRQGANDEAVAAYRRALVIRERTSGPETLEVSELQVNMCMAIATNAPQIRRGSGFSRSQKRAIPRAKTTLVCRAATT